MLPFAVALRGLFADAEQEGQSLVEYVLILALIAVVVLVALTFFQGKVTTLYSRVGNSLT